MPGFGCYHDYLTAEDAFPDPYRVPSVAALALDWAEDVLAMERLHNATGKQVMCIEVGVQSRPWAWTWRHPLWAGGDNDTRITAGACLPSPVAFLLLHPTLKQSVHFWSDRHFPFDALHTNGRCRSLHFAHSR